MRTKNFDPNDEYAYREACCKRGVNPSLTAYLPVNRPPFFKRRVAELYARYKIYPVSVHAQPYFPKLGTCIVFIPFTHSLLGKYDYTNGVEAKEYFAKMINEKAPKKRRK